MENKIDKIFNDSLNAYSSDVAPVIWTNIEKGIAPRSNKWRIWVLLLLAFLLLLGVLYFIDKPNVQPKQPKIEGIAASIHGNEEDQNKEDLAQAHLVNNNILKSITEQEGKAFKNQRNLNSYTLNKQEDLLQQASSAQINLSNNTPLKTQRPSAYVPVPNQQISVKADAIRTNFLRCDSPIDQLSVILIEPFDYNIESSYRTKTLGDCFEGPPSRFMMGFNLSMDYPFRSIKGAASGELLEYRNSRNSTESEIISFSTGIQGGYFHPTGLLVKSGLQYSQINERFLLVTENVIKIQTHITIDTMINSDGTYTITRDSSIVEVLGREEMKTVNQFRMLDVPLILGYTFDWRNLSLEVNAGVIFNITSTTGGRILDQDLVPTYYGTKGNDFQPYKNHYGIALYGGFSLLSNFYGKTQLFIEPNARYYVKSFSSSDYPLRQNYFVIGLATGVRYYF